ncbi:NADP-dependent malic enzyme [Amycolatopsis acidiphila]|uniref:NADP-dependent malic enzyme n=1 Tax=Amycolatopsis acidiphila TaxID=715473 RepID=A0A558AKK2_9PSEU|nr:malic enzyme-like NAD(P)-binding protein [Amycolatopsis acidiphila]TVT24792.1 NADP-dependent malic enzyme [Amycolatopsis acidiphila]UIJ62767.1 NADP-dependent malic enzyme [Amycolatopsis acidiphila]GHG64052.1 malate dehydrogenase [Amycolatopsis acidiphila]
MAQHSRGKIETAVRVGLDNPDDLSRHYTPGVAEQAQRVAEDPAALRRETVKANSVAIVSDGSALLGLGDQGPAAALPVMEGKAALLKRFADVDAWPICPLSRDPEDLIRTVRDLATSFGAINLEDIAAPRCFEIERRLRDELDVPVFHDDQHGIAIVVLGALHGALRLTERKPANTTVVISGAGAAGSAIARLLLEAGYRDDGIVVCDSSGVLHPDRDLDGEKRWLAEHANTGRRSGELRDALEGADVFVGVSVGGILDGADLARMADRAIVFALANPEPEVDPRAAAEHAEVVATGRSDHPNQINNVLAFPGVFRGLLDSGAPTVTTGIQLAAAEALAGVAAGQLSAERIVPGVFDEELVPAMALRGRRGRLTRGRGRRDHVRLAERGRRPAGGR